MIDEYIDIVDREGKPTGKIALKSEAHKKGWYHNTVHLWLYTENGDILLQQRSHKKLIYPLLWNVSVAGHIDAGETFTEAVLRETKEEIGLDLLPENLKKIGVFLHESEYANSSIKDYEFHNVYIAMLNVPVKELQPQEDEVEALKLVSTSEFKTLLEAPDNNHFINTNKAYYYFILDEIINQFNS